MAGCPNIWAKGFLFYLYLTCVTTSCNYVDESQPQFEGLPFCSDAKHDDKRYVLISTLDGTISALNVEDGGSLSWSLPTGDAPMLSSSIHRLELTSNGQYVRMIPSLSGNLYKFDGKYIEPVPINANHLLRNSFRYSEDLVISGGRETMTYGLDLETGRRIYECTIKGCDRNFTGQDNDGHVLVVQRQTQTIRALEPRTGHERWNFSVAQHDVKLLNDPNSECHYREQIKDDDLIIKVIVPDGLVCALSKNNPSQIVWKHKFKFPVVHAWQYSQGEVKSVDMFSGAFTPPLRPLPSAPSLYVGMHEKQVYIQESVRVQHGVGEESIPLITNGMPTRIPWKPYPASVSAIGLIESNEVPLLTDDSHVTEETTALSQSVLYGSEYANGNGFYLFKPVVEKVCDKNSTVPNEDDIPQLTMEEDDEETPVQIVIVSLWYWWKEVLIICITTTLVSNFLCTQRYLLLRRRLDHYLIVDTRSRQNSDSGVEFGRSFNTGSEGEKTPDFTSRYLDDFEQIRCLGKGGFGVVFEAKKKIDDCHYAVKRIQLPNRKESQERVMREVKALATLGHDNIVRYYHSWIERPPPGWQVEQDRFWLKDLESKDSLLPGDFGTEFSQTNAISQHIKNHMRNDSVCLKIHTDDSSSLKGPAAPELSDSFIQFKDNTSQANNEESQESDDDTASFIKFQKDELEEITKNSGALQPYVPVSIPISSSESCEEENIEVSSDDEFQKRLAPAPTFLYIQMQLCKKESLREWLQKRNVQDFSEEELHDFSIEKSILYFHQITLAVEYIHNQNLIHRDLKPSNIFLSIDGQVKIGDFGLVTAMTEPENGRTPSEETNPWTESDNDCRHTANVGTRLYMSPEQVLGLPYGHKVDIFSMGLILYEMLVPFRTLMERAHSLQLARDGHLPDNFLSQFQNESHLLRLMLSHFPDERPTAQEVRQKLPISSPQ